NYIPTCEPFPKQGSERPDREGVQNAPRHRNSSDLPTETQRVQARGITVRQIAPRPSRKSGGSNQMQSQTYPTKDLGGNPPQEATTIGRANNKGSQDGQAEDEAGRTHTKTEARHGPPETDTGLQSEHVS